MSERILKVVLMVIVLLLLASSIFSYRVGKEVGRAEQKKWDATWYAEHPVVVKERVSMVFSKPVEFIGWSVGATTATNTTTVFPSVPCTTLPAPKPESKPKFDWFFYYMRGYRAALFDQEQMRKFEERSKP